MCSFKLYYHSFRRKVSPIKRFETFTVDHLKHSDFKREWVLEHNELLNVFREYHILRYREMDRDEKAFASMVARKKNDA